MEEGVKLIVDKFWQGSRVDGRCYSGWIDLVTETRRCEEYEVQFLPSEQEYNIPHIERSQAVG
jgi:hypothetical protein